ncbi:MAG: cadmium-translocating P-type ATPase [Desulfovibrionales bacterium]|nr:cadmium-translocating P-type ATPase [Desulfovibrionales bacterium]
MSFSVLQRCFVWLMPSIQRMLATQGTDAGAAEVHRHSTFEEAAQCEVCAARARLQRKHIFLNYDAMMLYAAAVLFVCELLLQDWFHEHNLLVWELLLVLVAYGLAGGSVIANAARTVWRGDFFDENVLMLIATVGALCIHAYAEAIGIMIFFKVGELMQSLAVAKSRHSITALLSSKPEMARVHTGAGILEKLPEEVVVGDKVTVRPGEKIPLDGVVVEGTSTVNTAAITGESMPVPVAKGSEVMAGQICVDGVITLRVTRLFAESSIAKVLELVESATERKAKTEKFMTTFARYYTPHVVAIAVAVAFVPPLLMGGDLVTWVYRALVLLVISCPCALVISIPLGYFGGIGRASRAGILVKGSNYIDALAAVSAVAFDKTGTLTHGVFDVLDVLPAKGFSRERVLEMAAAAESNSTHPVGRSILEYCDTQNIAVDTTRLAKEKALVGKGVSVLYDGHDVLAGNAALMREFHIIFSPPALDGTHVHVAIDRVYAGAICIGDALRADAKQTIDGLKRLHVTSVMLTGDTRRTASVVAESLGIDRFYAGLLPEQKVDQFETLKYEQGSKGKTAFLGDGINDAPVIARADVGMAMGGLGSDAAIETADVVFMTDHPSKVVRAISIARKTRAIVWQNIGFAVSVKVLFITLGIFGIATMWEAVFADVGTSLLALANSTRILRG